MKNIREIQKQLSCKHYDAILIVLIFSYFLFTYLFIFTYLYIDLDGQN